MGLLLQEVNTNKIKYKALVTKSKATLVPIMEQRELREGNDLPQERRDRTGLCREFLPGEHREAGAQVLSSAQERRLWKQKPLVQIDTLDILLSEIELRGQNSTDCVGVIQSWNLIFSVWQGTEGTELGRFMSVVSLESEGGRKGLTEHLELCSNVWDWESVQKWFFI